MRRAELDFAAREIALGAYMPVVHVASRNGRDMTKNLTHIRGS